MLQGMSVQAPAMKTQLPSSVKQIRQAIALALLGLWLGCGLSCVGQLLGSNALCASGAQAGASACCHHHKSPTSSPDEEKESPGVSGSTCCDAITKPSATSLQPPVAGIVTSGFAGLGAAAAGTILPLPPPVITNRLLADKPPLVPPVQLLDGPHFAHDPPVRS
jgi:hypothetical protein